METRLSVVGIILLSAVSLSYLAECGGGGGNSGHNGTTTFSKADLEGTWEMNDLSSPYPWWSRGTVTFGSNGSFAVTSYKTSDDAPIPTSGTIDISSDGTATVSFSGIPSPYNYVMDSGKSVIIGTGSASSNRCDLQVITKKAAGYSLTDLEGTWNMNSIGVPGPWWSQGQFTIGSDGSFTVTVNGSDSSTNTISGTFDITTEGIITSSAMPSSFRCVMDSGKSISVCTHSDTVSSSSEMNILTKKAANYSLDDLKGTWKVTQLIPQDTWYGTGTMTFGSDGSFTGTIGTGSDSSVSGTINISTTDGIMTPPPSSEPSVFECAMDADKSFFICTFNTSQGSYPTILIAIK